MVKKIRKSFLDSCKRNIKKVFVRPTPFIYIQENRNRGDDFRRINRNIYRNTSFFNSYVDAYNYMKEIYTIQDLQGNLSFDSRTAEKHPVLAIIEETGFESKLSYDYELCERSGIALDQRLQDFKLYELRWHEKRYSYIVNKEKFYKMDFEEFQRGLEKEIFLDAPGRLKDIKRHYVSEYYTAIHSFFKDHIAERIPCNAGEEEKLKHTKFLVEKLRGYIKQVG